MGKNVKNKKVKADKEVTAAAEIRPTIKDLERMAFRRRINEVFERCQEQARILCKRSATGFKPKS